MDFMHQCRRLAGGRGGVCCVLRLGAGGSGLPAGAGYFAACLAGHAVPGGRSGLRPAAPRAAARPHNEHTVQPTPVPGPGANAHSFAHAGTKPYAAAQHRTANRGRRAYPGRAVPPRQGRRAASLPAFRRAASATAPPPPTQTCAAAVTTANLPFAVELNSDEPQVLILHTHATESYQTWPDPRCSTDSAARPAAATPR